jgi:DNA-binding IclR family transcriptional regulator
MQLDRIDASSTESGLRAGSREWTGNVSRSPAQFAIRTMRALEVLAVAPATAPKVAQALGVHPRTARRVLNQLQRDGWLSYSTQTPRVYAPTLRVVALAGLIGARAPLATLTTAAVEELHAASDLDACLAIPGYGATVSIVRCAGGPATQPPLASVAPAHCTATGKVLMAHRDSWRRSILDAPLARCTDRTVTDPCTLDRELAQVRMNGYAVENGEHRDGVVQFAAPVKGPRGEVLAAIAVALSGEAASPALLERAVELVKRAADAASAALAAGAEQYPLHRGLGYRLFASYGLALVDAYL